MEGKLEKFLADNIDIAPRTGCANYYQFTFLREDLAVLEYCAEVVHGYEVYKCTQGLDCVHFIDGRTCEDHFHGFVAESWDKNDGPSNCLFNAFSLAGNKEKDPHKPSCLKRIYPINKWMKTFYLSAEEKQYELYGGKIKREVQLFIDVQRVLSA